MLQLTIVALLVSALSMGAVPAPLAACALPCCERAETAPRCACGDSRSCCAAPSPAQKKSPEREKAPPENAPVRVPAVDALVAFAEPAPAQPDLPRILRAADSPRSSIFGGRMRRHLELTVLLD